MTELAPGPDAQAELARLRGELADATAAACKAYEDNARMVRVLAVLGQPGTPEQLSGRVLTLLCQSFHADVSCLTRRFGNRIIVTSDCGLAPNDPARTAGWPIGPGAAAGLSGAGPASKAGDELDEGDVPAELDWLGVRSAAWVPLRDGATGELLVLFRHRPARFTTAELQVLASVAFRLSVALATRERSVLAERLSRSGHRLSQHLDLGSLFAETCVLMRELKLAESTAVFTVTGDRAVLSARRGRPIPVSPGQEVVADSLPGWAELARGGQPWVTGSWDEDPRLTVLCVPVMIDDRPAAVMYAARDGHRPFAEGDLEVATTVAYYLRSAMMNAELYRALRESEATLRLITDSISDLVAVVDESCVIRYASPSHERELGYPTQELHGRVLTEFVHPGDVTAVRTALANPTRSPKVEYRMRAGGRGWTWVETALRPAQTAEPSVVLSSRVIEERRRLEEELRQQATHDPLTGLANRVLAGQWLESALSRAGDESGVGLLFCDLDRFKEINDRLGHDVGDELLILVAERLRGCVRHSDLLARIGGDEFVFLLDGMEDLEAVNVFGRRVASTLAAPFALRGESVPVTASIGGVLGRSEDSSPQAMMRNADAAMYAAKRRGTGLVEVFDDAASHRSLDRLTLSSDLRQALDRGELAVFYQPIFDISTYEILRFEALIRWCHPERGMIGPDLFIPLAEESGSILPIGSWVLEQSTRQLWQWQQLPGYEQLTVSVNVSAVQLRRPTLAKELLAIIDQSGVDRRDVWLEVTEHGAVSADAAAVIRQLANGGAHVCLDDFGVSHSNLDYLASLPVDGLKIDRQFIMGLTGEAKRRKVNQGIVRAVLAIADALELNVVAEGIETGAQRLALLGLGCSRGQGFLLSRPLPADKATALLRMPVETVLSDAAGQRVEGKVRISARQ